MNELQIFTNSEFGEIRTITKDGEPIFCLADVCKALKITHVTDVKERLKKDGVATTEVIDRLGRKQKAIFINESNLYKTIFQSRKESAERFTDWVTSEVLPQIRKTGGYIPVAKEDDDLTIMIKAFQILDRTVKQKDALIRELQPKADTYDMVMTAYGTFSMNQVAKQVGMGEYHLFAYLRNKKVLFYENGDNVPYERFRKNGCFRVIDTISPDGNSHSTTRVTQKGVDYICKLIQKDNKLEVV